MDRAEGEGAAARLDALKTAVDVHDQRAYLRRGETAAVRRVAREGCSLLVRVLIIFSTAVA